MEKEFDKRDVDDSAPTLRRSWPDMPRKKIVAETEPESPHSDDSGPTLLREESNDWAQRDARKVGGTDIQSSEGSQGGTTRVVTGTVQPAPGRHLADQGLQWRDVILILGVLMMGLLIMAMIIRLS